jgi:PAS domain S-box-containing protein
MFMLDPHGRVLIWNYGAERINGYRAEEIMGRHLSCFYLPEEIARRVPEQHIQCAAQNGYLAAEGWRVRKNGSRFWASVVMTALRERDGSLHGFAHLARDLTARRQAPGRAWETAVQVEGLSWASLSALPEQICVLDRDGTIVLTNRAWDQAALANGADLTRCGAGRNYLQICRAAMGKSTEGATKAAAGIESVLQGALPRFTLDYPCPSPKRTAWFQLSVMPLPRPQTGAVISHFDITDRAVLAKKLHRSEAFYGALIENAADVAAILAPDGTIRYQHPACACVLGFTPTELVGRQIFEFVHPDDLDSVRALLRNCLRRPHLKHSAEYRVQDKHGAWLVLESSVRSLVSNPVVAGIVMNSRDITHARRAREALLERQETLEHNRDELRLLATQLFRDQEDDRRRVAADLHDNLALRVAALALEAGTLASRAASTLAVQAGLHSLQDRAARLGHDLCRIADGLRPSVLAHLGVGVALRDRCAEFARKTGIPVHYSHRGLSSHIPQEIAACLYRTTEHVLDGIAKHGGVERASLTVSKAATGLRLTIRYNGAGCQPQEVRPDSSLDLLSMQERLRAVNGSISVRARPRHGMEIVALVPLVFPADQPRHSGL